MNTKTNPFVRPITASLAAGAMMTGLLFAGAPAANAQSNTVSQPSVSQAAVTGAKFWAEAATVTNITAGATSVAIAGADATAKILLEEVRTVDANKPAGKAPVPTKAQVNKAPIVHSMDEADALSAKLIKAYDKKVRKATKRVKKILAKLKYSKTLTVEERSKLKRNLKKARKALKKAKKDVPRMKGAHGMEFENTGYRDRKDLQPYADKVDGLYDVFQYVPKLRDWIIIVKIGMNGTWIEACHNYVGFYIPPNTPDRSLFLIVRVAAEVQAEVKASYTETITLTVVGQLTCPSGEVVQKDKTVTITKAGSITRTGVPVTNIDEAIRFGNELVRAHKEVTVGTSVSISDSLVQSIGAELELICADTKPYIDIVQSFEHLYADATPDNNRDDGGLGRMKVVIGDLEDSPERILANFSVASNVSTTGPVKVLVNDSNYPVHVAIEGNQVVAYFWLRALALQDPTVAENFTVTVWYTDAAGNRTSVTTAPKPVMPDDF